MSDGWWTDEVGTVHDIRLGLSARGRQYMQSVEMIEAAVADHMPLSIVKMTDETWPPGVAAGAVTDYWEARFEDAFAAGPDARLRARRPR